MGPSLHVSFGPGVTRAIGGIELREVDTDGSITVLRPAEADRDIAVFQARAPAAGRLLGLSARLGWLDGARHVPRVIATGRSGAGDESIVVELAAHAVTVASGLHPLQPETVAQQVGGALRTLHGYALPEASFDASPRRFFDLAAGRIDRGEVTTATHGPYAGRDPDDLLAILDELLSTLDDGPMVLVHGRPTMQEVWLGPSGDLVFTGWDRTGAGDPHHDLAVAAESVRAVFGPAAVPPLLDAYGLDEIDVRRIDAHQLLTHLLD